MTSSRMPGKVLKPILGRPMLALLVERLQRARTLDGICIATTDRVTDAPIEALARELGVGCWRGSEHDVLARVLDAAHSARADVIVEITADCPLIDPEIVDQLVETYLANDYDYVANILKRTYPDGLDTQVFSTRTLEQVAALTDDPSDREHVSVYIYTHPERFKLHNIESSLPERYWDIRLTVDKPEDFERIRNIYEALFPSKPAFALRDVIALLDVRPEWVVGQ
jgi:spore coat polysaccharide biosynthesis protein SpsF